MNDTLWDYCQKKGLEFTRSRAYRKNDQAWVEQKNGAVVRKLVGYGRLEGLAATAALCRLYEASSDGLEFGRSASDAPAGATIRAVVAPAPGSICGCLAGLARLA